MSFVDRVIAAYRTFVRKRDTGLVVPEPQFGAKSIGYSRRDFLRAVGITTMTSIYTPMTHGIWDGGRLYLLQHQVPIAKSFVEVYIDATFHYAMLDRKRSADYWNSVQFR